LKKENITASHLEIISILSSTYLIQTI